MKRTLKRGLSLLLMAAMLLSLFPAEVFAEDEQIGETPAEPTEIVSVEPSPDVTSEPSVEPDGEEGGLPTEEPLAEPTEEPVVDPTEGPTGEPLAEPTEEPSSEDPAEEPSTELSEEVAAPEEPLPDEGEEEGKKPGDDDISSATLSTSESWVRIKPDGTVSYRIKLTGLPKNGSSRITMAVASTNIVGGISSDASVSPWGDDGRMHPNSATNAAFQAASGNTFAPYWYLAASVVTGNSDYYYIVSDASDAPDGEPYIVGGSMSTIMPGANYATVQEAIDDSDGLYGEDGVQYQLILHSDSALAYESTPGEIASQRLFLPAAIMSGARPVLTGPEQVVIRATNEGGVIGFAMENFGTITNIGNAPATINGVTCTKTNSAGDTDRMYVFINYIDDETLEFWVPLDEDWEKPTVGEGQGAYLVIASSELGEEGFVHMVCEDGNYPVTFDVHINYSGNGITDSLTIPVTVVYAPKFNRTFDVYVYERDEAQLIERAVYNTGTDIDSGDSDPAGEGYYYYAKNGAIYQFSGTPSYNGEIEGYPGKVMEAVSARYPAPGDPDEMAGSQIIRFSFMLPDKTEAPARDDPYVYTFQFKGSGGNLDPNTLVTFNVHVLPRAKLENAVVTIPGSQLATSNNSFKHNVRNSSSVEAIIEKIELVTPTQLSSFTYGDNKTFNYSQYNEGPLDEDDNYDVTAGWAKGTTVSGNGTKELTYSWDIDNARALYNEGTSMAQVVKITYKDAASDTLECYVAFVVEAQSLTSVTVQINKNGGAWPGEQEKEGFAGPTLVALTSVGADEPTKGTAVSKTGATPGSATISVAPGSYDVWVQRGTDGWKKVATNVSVSGASYTHTVNYYSATVKIAGGASNGYGIDWTGTTLTAVGDKASYNSGRDKVSSKLFLDISRGTTENIKYKLTLPTGVSLDGDPTPSGVNTTTDKFAKSGDTYQFIMPLNDVTITHDILLPWNVTIETVYGSTATAVKSIELRTTGSTSAAHSASDKSSLTVTNIAADASYEVWVNGFKTDKTVSRADDGKTVRVTLYKITPSVQYVTNASTVTPTSYTPQDTAPTVNIAATASGTANAAFAYVPQGATGTIAVAKTSGTTGRYTAHGTAWTKDAGTTSAVTSNNYTVDGINADVSLKANFIPSHKITIAASKRPGGVAISNNAPAASISVNGVTLANSGTTYVPIANANGTSDTFAVTDPTTTNTAYISPGDWEAAAAFGGTAGAYTTSADATVTPVFALKPTILPDSIKYDIGSGAKPDIKYSWTKNDAASDKPTEITASFRKDGDTTDTAKTITEGTDYSVTTASGVATITFSDTFKASLEKGVYTFTYASSTGGEDTPLTTTLEVTSTARALTEAKIGEKVGTATTPTIVTNTQSGKTVEWVSHKAPEIREQDLTWTWYRASTTGTLALAVDANKIADPTAGKSGSQYTVQNEDKGYYIFAKVEAKESGSGTVITNSIAVDYEVSVKTMHGSSPITVADWGATVPKIQVNTGTAINYTDTFKFTVTPGVSYTVKASPAAGNNTLVDVATISATGAFTTSVGSDYINTTDYANRTIYVPYYTVSTGAVMVDNGIYTGKGFATGTKLFADDATSPTTSTISAKVGTTAVTSGGYVLSKQDVTLSASNWGKDYKLQFKNGASDLGSTHQQATSGATQTLSSISADATITGVLSLNLYDVTANVTGNGSLTEITMALVDGTSTYTFSTKSEAGKILGTKSQTDVSSVNAVGSVVFRLPNGEYAVDSTEGAGTTREGYRNAATGTLTKTGYKRTVSGDTSYYIVLKQTGLFLNVTDGYTGAFSDATSKTATAKSVAGTKTDGTMTRTVTVPYQFDEQTIKLTLANDKDSTGPLESITVVAAAGNPAAPILTVTAPTGIPATGLAVNTSNNTATLKIKDTDSHVAPGTYTYTVEISFTGDGNTPKVTYTLNVVVEEGKLISSTIKQNSETATVTNGKPAKVDDTLNFDNFVAQKLTNYNGTYGAATYANGKDDFDAADYTYQWQTSANGAAATPTWTDISGANNATYTIQAGDAGKDIRLLVKSVANGKLIETAPSAYVSVGYNATVTVNEDGSAIAAEGDYAVTLRPKTGTSGDVALTFDSTNKVFTTNGSAALVRGVEYSIVVKNGTYASAKDTTLTATIKSTSTTETVNYYTVKYMSSIAAAQRYEYKTGSGETFASDPAISAVVVGDSNKAIATGKSVLSSESVKFSTSWTQDYSIAWKMTGNSNAIADGDSTLTSTLSGTKNENLTRSYTAAANTVYATLTQKTYTVKGKVANETGKSGGTLDSATLTDGRTSLVYATKGTGITSGNSISGTGAPSADITFVLPKGTYTIGGAPGSATSLDGYAVGTGNTHQTEPVNLTVSADATNAFKIFVEGEKINLVVTDTDAPTTDLKAETTRFYAYAPITPINVKLENDGNNDMTVTKIEVFKGSGTTAITDFTSEPVTFTIPDLGENGTVLKTGKANNIQYTISPKDGQTNDKDTTYKIKVTATTAVGTTVTNNTEFTYTFKVNPVTVASVEISGSAISGQTLTADYAITQFNHATGANETAQRAAVKAALEDSTGSKKGRDIGYAWFRANSALTNPTFTAGTTPTLTGATFITGATNPTYTVTAADDGKVLYLVVYGKSTGDTDTANANGSAITRIDAHYTGEITVNLDNTKVTSATDAARYIVQLREGTNTISTTFDATKGVYKTNSQLDPTKTYTVWATRSTTANDKTSGSEVWVDTTEKVSNTSRSATVNYYTTAYDPNAAVNDNGNGIKTDTTLTGPIDNAVSAIIKGTTVALTPTDAVLRGTTVTFKYDKTKDDKTTGTARHWSDTGIQAYYKMTWGGSAATPAAAYSAVVDKDVTPTTDPITKVTAELSQEVYTITFKVSGNGGTVSNPTLTVETGKGSGSRVATGATGATGTFNTTTDSTVIFSNMPAGDYALTSTAGSETVIVSYAYGPDTTKTTTQIKGTANTSAPVPVTKSSTTNNLITLEASTYIVNWYEKGTAADWSDKKADTSEVLGTFVYGYAAPTAIERRLYNTGNTEIPALKITENNANASVVYKNSAGTDVTTTIKGTGVNLPVGDYIVAEITTATGKDYSATAYSSELTASSSKTLTGNRVFTPSYTIAVATIDAYDLSTIAAPATGVALDTVTGKTQQAKLVTESTVQTEPAGGRLIATGTTMTWAPPTTPAAAGTVYTVTVVASAISNNYVFSTDKSGYTLNGVAPTSSTLSNNNRTLTLTYTFPATAPTVVSVVATANGGYTAKGTITANATSTVNQEMFWVVTEKGATAPANAAAIVAADGWVDFGHGDAVYRDNRWELANFDIDGLEPGTEYTIYATSRNKANTDAVGNMANADFKTWYRVDVVTNPTTGAGSITAPATVSGSSHTNDNGKHVTYVAPGSSTTLSASLNTGVTYVFGNWTETAAAGDTGAVAVGTNITNQQFTPTKNTTVYANFTAKAKLKVTGPAIPTSVTVNTPVANVVADAANVENIGTGSTTGNVKALVTAAGTTWNPASRPTAVTTFSVTKYTTEKKFDAGESEVFGIAPASTATVGTYKARVFFYDAGEPAIYDYIDVELTVVAAGAAVFNPTSHQHDLYLEGKSGQPATQHSADWNITITHNNDYTELQSIQVTAKPAGDTDTTLNADIDTSLYTFTAGTGTHTLKLEAFVRSVAAKAKAGDSYTIQVVLKDPTTSNTSPATLTLTFVDTTPHITAASITQTSLTTDAATATATATATLDRTTYNPTSSNNVHYQWYRTDSATKPADTNWTKGGTNPHDAQAVWTWDDATAIAGANTASYTATADDSGHYLYVVATGDDNGDYVRNGAVSTPVYVSPTVAVVIDGMGNDYGTASVGTKSTTKVGNANKQTQTVGAGGNVTINAVANSSYYFTGWTFDNYATGVAATASQSIAPTGNGDVTAHANFDKLPTLTKDETFDTSAPADVTFTYTKNDGSGHVKIEINGVTIGTGKISGSSFTVDSGTSALPTGVTFNGTALKLTKEWIAANLPSSGSSATTSKYDVKINDLDKGAAATTGGYAGYDKGVKITVVTNSYTVTSYTDKQSDGKWSGKYLGTVKTGSSAASVLDSGNGNSVASVQSGNTVTLVATPRTGYSFKQWTVMEGDDPATAANAKGYFGTSTNKQQTSTSATATFTPTANVAVRAEFVPIDFTITTTTGYVEYAATGMARRPAISASAESGTQTFAYAVAAQAEVTAAGETWDARDDAALPSWLAMSAAGAVTFTAPATGVNVEKKDDGSDYDDELSVWVKVTSNETGLVHYKKLVVNVQPSQLSFDVAPTYPTIYVGDSVSTTGIATVNAINNITPVSVSTRANSWKQIEWTITGATESDPVDAAIDAPGNYTYNVTASWNPDDANQQYNYLPVSAEVQVTAMPTSHLFGFVKEEGSVTPIHSDVDTAIYLTDVGEYIYFLKNIKDKLYKTTVTASSTAFNVSLANADGTAGTSATSFNIGDMETSATQKFIFTPKSGVNFTVGEYKVTLTATGYPRADSGAADKMTQIFEFTYKVNPKPISIVDIEKLDLSGLTVGDSITALWTQNAPRFTDVDDANEYSYKVRVNGDKDQTLTDSLIGIRTKNNGVADKYNQTPYTMEYRWTGVGSTAAAGDSAILEVTLVANENYVFTAEPNETTTHYEFDYNDGADKTATGTVSNQNSTLKFTVGPIQPLLKNIDVRVTAPTAGSTPAVPDYANATHVGYEFDADAVGGNTFYEWFKVGADGDTPMTASDEFEQGETYKVVIHVDRNETAGKWVPNDQIVTTGNGSRLQTTGTNNAVHDGTDTTITLQWTLQKVTPPPVAPSTTYYEVNYIIVPGGNTPDPTTELVAAGGYPEHVPHVTPNNNDEYQFIGWVRDDPTGKTIKEIVPNLLVKPEMVKINQDTDFYAVYGLREIKVTYDLGSFGKTDDPTQEIVAKYAYPSFAPDVTIVDQYKNLARFVGWSIEKPDHALVVNLVDPLTTQIINDTVFYAVYEIDKYNYHEHYMIGYPNGEFRPEGKITRAEVATIIARAVMPDFIEFNDYGDGGYSDVTGHWAQSAIAFCSNTGVFVGYEDGTFRPNKPITREEYALVIARIQGLTDCEDRFVMPFKDVETVSGWALDGVYTCYDEGWIDGYEDAEELGTYTFAPQRDIGRAEAAKIMNGYLNRGVNEAGVSSLNEYIQFPDVPKWYWGYWEVAEAVNDHYYYYYLEDEAGKDVPPEEWIVEAGYLNVKLDENDPDNTKNVRRSDPVYVNAN